MERELVEDYFQKSGFTKMQADALSRIMSEHFSEMEQRFATKEDLLRMESRLTWRMIAIVGFFGTVITLLNVFVG